MNRICCLQSAIARIAYLIILLSFISCNHSKQAKPDSEKYAGIVKMYPINNHTQLSVDFIETYEAFLKQPPILESITPVSRIWFLDSLNFGGNCYLVIIDENESSNLPNTKIYQFALEPMYDLDIMELKRMKAIKRIRVEKEKINGLGLVLDSTYQNAFNDGAFSDQGPNFNLAKDLEVVFERKVGNRYYLSSYPAPSILYDSCYHSVGKPLNIFLNHFITSYQLTQLSGFSKNK